MGGIGCAFFAVRASINTGTDLRSAVYRKISTLSFGNLDTFGTGQLVTRLTNDVTQVQDVIMISLRVLVRVPLIGVGSMVMAFLTSPQLALVALPLVLPVMLMLWWVVRRAHPRYMQVQRSLDRINTVIQENLAGVRVIKAFVREQHEKERFGEANTALVSSSVRAMDLTSVIQPVMLLLLTVGTTAVLWLGGINVAEADLTTGEIIAVITYLSQMLSTLVSVSMLLNAHRAGAGLCRAYRRGAEHACRRCRIARMLLQDFQARGRVAFEHVTFGYGEPVLKDVSFVAEPGQTVAILGTTGSGKTSLVHLIPRFYDVNAGRVTIDGIDVRDISQAALRGQMSIALQEAVLFSGTVAENIRQGNAGRRRCCSSKPPPRRRRRKSSSTICRRATPLSSASAESTSPVGRSSGWRLRARWCANRPF